MKKPIAGTREDTWLRFYKERASDKDMKLILIGYLAALRDSALKLGEIADDITLESTARQGALPNATDERTDK